MVSCLLGLFLIWVAVASPVAALDVHRLTAHMAQHLLLMTLAPPLVLLGAPLLSLWYALPRRFADAVIGPLLRWRLPARRLGKALGGLAVCWTASTATIVGWHVPAVFAVGMRSAAWHGVEQASFLATGFLFWWPVVRPWPSVTMWPRWSLVLYLFLATLPCDVLSGFLVFSERVAYPVYLVCLAARRTVRTRGPANRWCADVDVRHDCLPRGRDDPHHTLALRAGRP